MPEISETDRSTIDIHILKIWREHVPDPKKAGEFREVHKIEWAKRGTNNSTTVETVSRLQKDAVLWARIEPSYQHWLKGQETPLEGTPLEAWPGMTEGRVAQLRLLHVRTVEEYAAVTDATLDKIGMGARSERERARIFVEAKKGSAQIEHALAGEREKVANLEAQMAEMRELIASLPPKKRKPAEVEAA